MPCPGRGNRTSIVAFRSIPAVQFQHCDSATQVRKKIESATAAAMSREDFSPSEMHLGFVPAELFKTYGTYGTYGTYDLLQILSSKRFKSFQSESNIQRQPTSCDCLVRLLRFADVVGEEIYLYKMFISCYFCCKDCVWSCTDGSGMLKPLKPWWTENTRGPSIQSKAESCPGQDQRQNRLEKDQGSGKGLGYGLRNQLSA